MRSAGSWGQGQRKRVRKKKGERGVEGEKMNELYFMRSKTDLYIYIYIYLIIFLKVLSYFKFYTVGGFHAGSEEDSRSF